MKDDEIYKMVQDALKKKNIIANEDELQQIVTHVHLKLAGYDPNKGKLSTYLYKIIINSYYLIKRVENAKKRQSNKNTYSLDNYIEDDEGKPISMLELQADENVDIVYNYIKRKTLEQIEPLVEEPLRMWLDGFKQAEIAEKFNVTQSIISRKINNNIIKIKNYCKENGIELEVR